MKKAIWALALGAGLCAASASAGYFIPDSQAFDFLGKGKAKKTTAARPAEPSTSAMIQKMFAYAFGARDDQVIVVPQSADFVVSVPANSGLGIVEDAEGDDQTNTFLMEKADDFFRMTQYRMSLSDIRQIQPFIFPFILGTPISAEMAQADLYWIPKFNIFSQKSIALQQAAVDMPGNMKVAAGQASLESTTIVNDAMRDTMLVYELGNATLSAGWGSVSAQQVSGKTSLLRLPVSGRWETHVERIQWQNGFMLDNLSLTLLSDKTPALTGRFAGRVNKEKTLDIGFDMSQITFGQAWALLFPHMPRTISAQVSISNLDPVLKIIGEYATQAQQNPNQAPVLKQIALDKINGMWSDVRIDIKQISAANETTKLTLSGWLVPPKSGVNALPEAELKMQVVNLDILSPRPKVNKAACNYAKTTARKDASPAELAQIQRACKPQGGILDAMRPYLNAKARVRGPNNQTIDTFDIAVKNDKVKINGKDATADFFPPKP
ncbi:MAG: hypothetical protein PHX68_02180 [Alphaproteobacteria bacterium]|nr:hypothetical protein [Alphaproteobacteria bacterium]